MRRKLFPSVDVNENRTRLQIVNHGSPGQLLGVTLSSLVSLQEGGKTIAHYLLSVPL